MSDSKKRKKSFYKDAAKRARRNEELKPGLKGFIITCNNWKKNAVGESYRLLNEYADLRYGPEKFPDDLSDSDNDTLSLEEALDKEVKNIKDACKKDFVRRFQSVENKAKSVIFIKTTLDNPAELVCSIFDDILALKTRKSKYCLRFLPVVNTCYAKTAEILKTAKPIITEYFHNVSTPFTFHIMWKVRCNNSIKRDDVLMDLVTYIHSEDKGHKADYNTPDVVFNIDVIGNICCFGILKNYYQYKKYNIDLLVPPIEVLKDEKTLQAASLKDSDDNPSVKDENSVDENHDGEAASTGKSDDTTTGSQIKSEDFIILDSCDG